MVRFNSLVAIDKEETSSPARLIRLPEDNAATLSDTALAELDIRADKLA